ncbi:MAG: DUF3048 domain-containing protein [Candidatus Saccharibacteria bacterium]|nr:DUF3048 domain-containing protein [Candidatus Saccharibacteria bacterium]
MEQTTPPIEPQEKADLEQKEQETKTVEPTQPKPEKTKKSKSWIAFLVLGIIFAGAGGALLAITLLKPVEERAAIEFPKIPSKTSTEKIYSTLTGKEIADKKDDKAPIYCVQTPNGTDGARPQAGLHDAGVIFEAIAEAGITRFAAIYQNPTSAVIGPIRSLRLYYLEWDTPFDCTIVHAGGAYDALTAVKNGGYKDLTENYTYMYRGTVGTRRWNNLFTNGEYLQKFTSDHGFAESNPQGFTHKTPEEAEKTRVDNLVEEKLSIITATTKSTKNIVPQVSTIRLGFGNLPNYNPVYNYNANTNTYDRSFASGVSHEVYDCPHENLGEKNPESVCELKQLSPSVVIAIMVSERKASDNYHEDITTTGSGTAYVFQNGTAVRGTWSKNTRADQIKFYDESNNEIALNPGQVIISAIPNYGWVEY